MGAIFSCIASACSSPQTNRDAETMEPDCHSGSYQHASPVSFNPGDENLDDVLEKELEGDEVSDSSEVSIHGPDAEENEDHCSTDYELPLSPVAFEFFQRIIKEEWEINKDNNGVREELELVSAPLFLSESPYRHSASLPMFEAGLTESTAKPFSRCFLTT
ncbi:unnamed protein product [Orchesella dallaii]|uniref:Uncharacterized protein n=1 Tax=Orchesella dallaii TaxID=48710 RepID=A0ABP1S7I3_9HEXA